MICGKSPCSKQAIGLALIFDVLVLDQLSKWAVLEYVMRGQVQPDTNPLSLWQWITHAPPRFPFASVEILPFFNLTMVWNEGISFGLFHGSQIWLLSGLAFIICAVFGVWLTKATGWLQAVSLAMVIGGAIGNVIDRFRFGAVADFLDFHAFGYHYPSFNVADCGVTVGIALLVIDGVFLEPKRTSSLEKSMTI